MDFINKLLDENYDWGDKRIDEDVYDELSAELIIDYLKKHDSEIRQIIINKLINYYYGLYKQTFRRKLRLG